MMAAAAADVAGIGSSLSEANAAAAALTTRVIPAAADEVSAAIASLFSSHGTAFQALSAQAAVFHSEFVQALSAGAGAYASIEAANAGPLQTLADLIADPSLLVPNVAVSAFGHPLVQLGSAHATTAGLGGLAVAVGANSQADASGGLFRYAFALGAGSDAAASPNQGSVDTAIAIGTNDVAVAAGGSSPNWSGPGFPVWESAVSTSGSFDTAVVVGTGSTADALYGNHNLAAVFGNMLTATTAWSPTGANGLVDIVTPFGTL
jgi:hypothetical protein